MKALLIITLATSVTFASKAQIKGIKDDIRGMMANSEKIDYEKLIDLFSDMVKQYPDLQTGYNNLGAAQFKMQEYAKALQNLNKALEISPNYPDAHYNRGLAKFVTKDYKGAAEDFKQASAIYPKDANSFYNLSLAQYYSGVDKTEILAALDEALKLDSKFEWAYSNRGLIKSEAGEYTRAAEDYGKAIAINDKDGDYFCNRGQAYLKLNNIDSACTDLKKAVELGNEKASKLAEESCK